MTWSKGSGSHKKLSFSRQRKTKWYLELLCRRQRRCDERHRRLRRDNLLIDTGSSNTWVGTGKAYVRTSTSVQTLARWYSEIYGTGSFSGSEFLETVTITPGLVITSGFEGSDCILGIGPVDLTIGTLSPDRLTPIPTVTDNLFGQGSIASNLVGVSFEPTTTKSVKNGELTIGAANSTKFTGSITHIPSTIIPPAKEFRGITKHHTGWTPTPSVTPRATPTGFKCLQSLFFTAGGTSFELTPNGQIWPRTFNTFIGGSSRPRLYKWLHFPERFYTVFDTTSKCVGPDTTRFTTATANLW
ncbi:aspartic peptidase domain-containing protein [Lactarius quietus]|nr:aspartic peptidase domain-containing protein [Lactarius quietus]